MKPLNGTDKTMLKVVNENSLRYDEVCLIIPPSIFLLDERVFVSLGVLKVAAVLEQSGIKVHMLDLSGVENFESVVKDYVKTNSNVKWFGLSATTPQMPSTSKIFYTIRECSPSARIVLGGPHVTLVYAAYKAELKKGKSGRGNKAFKQLEEMFDVLVTGDGEIAIFETLNEICPTIVDGDNPQSEFFLNNKILTDLPFPARHLVDVNTYKYTIDGVRALSLIAQLGCPFGCGFCFSGDTKIITSKGVNKQIKDIKAGDKVITFKNGILVEGEVKQTFKRKVNKYLKIKLENGKFLKVTHEHPFYMYGNWVEAQDLKVGDILHSITFNDKISINKKLYNPVERDLVRESISKTITDKIQRGIFVPYLGSPEYRIAIELGKFPFHTPTYEEKATASKRMFENNPMKDPEVVVFQQSVYRKRMDVGEIVPYMCTTEGREVIRETSKVTAVLNNCMWYDEVVQRANSKENQTKRRKQGFKWGNGPNKVEAILDFILQENFPDEFKFVGDGDFWIGKHIPDFVNVNGKKKVIELYGDYWHCNPEMYKQASDSGHRSVKEQVDIVWKRDREREKEIKEHGYEVLIVWEGELKDEKLLTKKLFNFITNGIKIVDIKEVVEELEVHNFECDNNNYFAEHILVHNCGGRYSPFLRRVRMRTSENIVQEMLTMHKTYGVQGFMFYDDELNVNNKFVELMNMIHALQKQLGVEFRLRGFVKSELFTEEQAEAMYRAGFRWLLCGFESGHDRILTNMQKKASQADNTRAVEIAKKHGLKVKALMSLGHPGESEETIKETRNWLLNVKPDDFDATVITTFPGSPYFDEAVETKSGIWTYTYAKTGDTLHQVEADYRSEATYYKGIPGEYTAFIYTDYLTSTELVSLRDQLEAGVRKTLNIPYNVGAPAVKYEHSMGQIGSNILRSSAYGTLNKN